MFIAISEPVKLKNESQWPKTYTFKFLEQGLVNYEDMKLGTLLLRKETIENMIPSFIDKPVIVRHQEVNEGNFTDIAVGYIKNIYFNSLDGWYYADCLITHDEGHKKLSNGWGVSCAYKVNQIISGGKYHNIEYAGEIVAGVGEHLALVENPRYEDCQMIVNGKQAVLYNEKTFPGSIKKQEDKPMLFNLFGKKTDKGFDGNAMVDIGNGKKAKLSEIIAFQNSLEETHEIDGKQEIELANGKKITLEEAVKNFVAKNVATDEKEKEDEDKDKSKDEGTDAKNGKKKMTNACSCGMKDGKHDEDCAMMKNDDSKDETAQEKKLEKMENDIKALKLENEALKAGAKHAESFVKLENARQTAEDKTLLENGTKVSGTLESKLESSKKYFAKK